MLEIYWGCMIVSLLIAFISVVTGDMVSDAIGGLFDAISADVVDFLHPMPVLGAISVFGASGIMLTEYSGLADASVAALSAALGVVISVALHFVYVRPMRKAENSLAYSVKELQGKIGEVVIPIPENGYGEIQVMAGRVPTYQIAGSFEGTALKAGTPVVVVEIRDGAFYVAPFDENDDIAGTGQRSQLPLST